MGQCDLFWLLIYLFNYILGIGPDVNINKLNEIASEPSEYFSFSVTSLDALSQIRRQMGLRICESTRYEIL